MRPAPIAHVLQFFRYEHLPPHLQEVSKKFSDLAYEVAELPDNPEVAVSLRSLLAARDAAVRAVVLAKDR